MTATPRRGAFFGGLIGLLFALSMTSAAPGARSAVLDSALVTDIATAEQFQSDVLEGLGKSVVTFSAAWCPACKAFAPTLNDVAEDYSGKVRFWRVDVDRLPALAETYRVEGIPMTIIFENGKEITRFIGAVSKDELAGRLL